MAKKEAVKNIFNDIASQYDALNHLLSWGIDKRWRKRALKGIENPGEKRILEVACGTGDFSIAAVSCRRFAFGIASLYCGMK